MLHIFHWIKILEVEALLKIKAPIRTKKFGSEYLIYSYIIKQNFIVIYGSMKSLPWTFRFHKSFFIVEKILQMIKMFFTLIKVVILSSGSFGNQNGSSMTLLWKPPFGILIFKSVLKAFQPITIYSLVVIKVKFFQKESRNQYTDLEHQ